MEICLTLCKDSKTQQFIHVSPTYAIVGSGEAAVVVIVRLGIISDYIDYVKFALTLSDRYIAH